MSDDQINVQYIFTDPDTGFRDAINLPLEDFKAEYGDLDSLDDDKIAQVKAERVSNWQEAVENPPEPEPVDPVVEAEAWAEQIKVLDDQRDQLAALLTERVEALPTKERDKLDLSADLSAEFLGAEAVAEVQ